MLSKGDTSVKALKDDSHPEFARPTLAASSSQHLESSPHSAIGVQVAGARGTAQG